MSKPTLSPWKKINWRKAGSELRKPQEKLYGALNIGASGSEVSRIHNEILNSLGARAMAVRRVTTNGGKKTPGSDKIIWTLDEQKYEATERLKTQWNKYEAKSVRRVWIPKADGITMRPLGIPTMFDRAAQTLFNFILDVHQEMGANPRSFGFRIGRNAKQAIQYAWLLSSGASKRWVMKVDIKKAYDRVNHKWLLDNTPINKSVLKQWLKAGVIDGGKLEVTNLGVPQGGSISPTIFNIVMEGVEDRIMSIPKCFPIRYADDIIIFANDERSLEKVKEELMDFLKPRGLELNGEKTVITTIEKGVDILGYNLREYPDATRAGKKGKPTKKGILIIKPSRNSIENFKKKVKNALTITQKSKALDVVKKLNPIIRGWANYFNSGGGWTKTKNVLGQWLWLKLKKWVYKKHRGVNVGRRVILNKYFKSAQRRENYRNNWTFFAVDEKGKEVLIADIQEIKVSHSNALKFNPSPNPYNPEDYNIMDKAIKLALKRSVQLNAMKQKLIVQQEGLCVRRGQVFDLSNEQVEIDHIIPKAEGGTNKLKNLVVLHKECHQQKTSWERKWRAYKRKLASKN